MNAVSRIFEMLNRRYLIRAYFIGLVFFGLEGFMLVHSLTRGHVHVGGDMLMLVLMAADTLLFPFSKFAWDQTRDFLMGNNIVFANAIVIFVMKLFVNILLWGFAIFVAPIGIGYLWFRSHRRAA